MRTAQRLLVGLLCLAFVALGVLAVRTPYRPAQPLASSAGHEAVVAPLPAPPTPISSDGPAGDCAVPSAFAAAANDNAATLPTLAVSPFGVAEVGWAAYAPLIAHEIGTACEPQTAGFASRFALWQSAHALPADGRLNAATLSSLSTIWLLRRPFVVASRKACPPSPEAATLARADAAEVYGGKTVLARAGALDAYRQMVAAARRDLGPTAPQLRIASAYRGPIEEAIRCAFGTCGTAGRARCSAHRTGLAFDLYLGAAPGFDGFSTDAANRLYLSRTPTYRWLVAHADRFGFVNYPYEPWHWEWTGEPI